MPSACRNPHFVFLGGPFYHPAGRFFVYEFNTKGFVVDSYPSPVVDFFAVVFQTFTNLGNHFFILVCSGEQLKACSGFFYLIRFK